MIRNIKLNEISKWWNWKRTLDKLEHIVFIIKRAITELFKIMLRSRERPKSVLSLRPESYFFPLRSWCFFFAFSAENRVLAGGSRMFPDLIAMVISCHDISMAFHTNLDMVMAIKWHDYHGCHETWYHHDMVVLEDCQELSGNHRNSHGNYYFEKCSFAICFTPENALKIW